jgi:CHAT domain-containing protein
MALFVIPAFPATTEAETSLFPENLGSVQAHLKPGEAILEYSLSDSALQVYAITREIAVNTSQTLAPLFWNSLKFFEEKLKTADHRDLIVQGEILYLFLVKPVQNFLGGIRRLIIIPGARLSGFPFETLVKNESSTAGRPVAARHFLVIDYEIVYHHSSIDWCEKMACPIKNPDLLRDESVISFLGCSPAFAGNGVIPSLPEAKHEIDAISELFCEKGLSPQKVCDGPGGKDCFKSKAGFGKIVHLATHYLQDASGGGVTGFVFPGNGLSGEQNQDPNEVLTLEEIAGMRLKADLIVLSTCGAGRNRNDGRQQEESMPGVFFAAGARNVLSALWNVTDKLAKEFMLDFYRQWLSGKTYSEALREVKLQWISCRETALPTIWAPYVLTGE